MQVLDARDPMGTRCGFLEQHIRKHLRHKHLLLLLNKCDLVSTAAAAAACVCAGRACLRAAPLPACNASTRPGVDTASYCWLGAARCR
eukprot:9857-Chlamydomonas_euryale.AAC.1